MNEEIEILGLTKQEYNKYFNTLVLYHFEVVKLVDIIMDEEDIYYIIDDGEKVFQLSVIISLIPLITKIKSSDYNELIRIWNLNKKNKI